VPDPAMAELLYAQDQVKAIAEKAQAESKRLMEEAALKARAAQEQAGIDAQHTMREGQLYAQEVAQAEQEKRAKEAAKAQGKPTDHPVTTTTQGVDQKINPMAPLKTLTEDTGEGIMELVSGGGGAQAAGPLSQGTRQMGQGGPPGISVGGQQFSAPSFRGSLSTEHGQRPTEVGPGAFVSLPYRSNRMNIEQNVLTPGDVLEAQVSQDQFGRREGRLGREYAQDHALRAVGLQVEAARAMVEATNDIARTNIAAGAARSEAQHRDRSFFANLMNDLQTENPGDPRNAEITKRFLAGDYAGGSALLGGVQFQTNRLRDTQMRETEARTKLVEQQVSSLQLEDEMTRKAWEEARSYTPLSSAIFGMPQGAGGAGRRYEVNPQTGKLTLSKADTPAEIMENVGKNVTQLFEEHRTGGSPDLFRNEPLALAVVAQLADVGQVISFNKLGTGDKAWTDGMPTAMTRIRPLYDAWHTFARPTATKQELSDAGKVLNDSGIFTVGPDGIVKATTAHPYDSQTARHLEMYFKAAFHADGLGIKMPMGEGIPEALAPSAAAGQEAVTGIRQERTANSGVRSEMLRRSTERTTASARSAQGRQILSEAAAARRAEREAKLAQIRERVRGMFPSYAGEQLGQETAARIEAFRARARANRGEQ
jgi:hypothetical protein